MQNELYFLYVIQFNTHLKETFEKAVFCCLKKKRPTSERTVESPDQS